MIIAISYDLLTSKEAANYIIQLEAKGDEFLVSLDRRTTSEEDARKAIDSLGIKSYRFMTPNDVSLAFNVARTTNDLIRFCVTKTNNTPGYQYNIPTFLLLSFFPITGALGFNDLYRKRKWAFLCHIFLILFPSLYFLPVLLSGNNYAIMLVLVGPIIASMVTYGISAAEGIIVAIKYGTESHKEFKPSKNKTIASIIMPILGAICLLAFLYCNLIGYTKDSTVFIIMFSTIISTTGIVLSQKFSVPFFINTVITILSFILCVLKFCMVI